MDSSNHDQHPVKRYGALRSAYAAGHPVVVPTRSLANVLLEEYNVEQLHLGYSAWVPPLILTWSDLVNELWRLNQSYHPHLANLGVLSGAQSLVLWERVLSAAKYAEDDLRLLNVSQTAKAAQSARQTCFDWGLDEPALEQFANLDLNQFLTWQASYSEDCKSRDRVDAAEATSLLASLNRLKLAHSKVYFYAFDLITSAQAELIELLRHSDVETLFISSGGEQADQPGATASAKSASESLLTHPIPHPIKAYSSDLDELYAVMQVAREALLTEPEAKIAVVIPDLQNRLSEVSEAARVVFYPTKTPLEAAQDHTAYRISLGKPLVEWPAISVALLAIGFLRNSMPSRDFALLLRSAYSARFVKSEAAVADFLRWLAEQRVHTLQFEELLALTDRFVADRVKRNTKHPSTSNAVQLEAAQTLRTQFVEVLEARASMLEQSSGSNRLSLRPKQWSEKFLACLEFWQWSTSKAGEDLSSEQFQLDKRFKRCLAEISDLNIVISHCGLSRAIDLLVNACNDSVFLPQAEPAPILISGIYEAIGREVDHLFLMGMSEEFPAPFAKTAFIPANALLSTANPAANHERHYAQMSQVVHSLIASAQACHISYAQRLRLEPDERRAVSPLFRHSPMRSVDSASELPPSTLLESYKDENGLAWTQGVTVPHGMSVFKEQSSCAFKAFATHRLKCRHIDEPEFGLEPSVQGTVIHDLLHRVWQAIGSKDQLENWFRQTVAEQTAYLAALVSQALIELEQEFNSEQLQLIRREAQRYVSLIREWLEFELNRPQGFAAVELEKEFVSELGGIEYKGSIDRIDVSDDGQVIIMDYKTGNVSRTEWEGERLENPQMPLYFLAHQKDKAKPADGVAYALVRRNQMSFSERAEEGILKKPSKLNASSADIWRVLREQWRPQLEELAAEFLAGEARVDPINDKACSYCPYDGLCRVKQLYGQFKGDAPDSDTEGGASYE